MPPEYHALLGASKAHQWMACTPSARLCERLERRLGGPKTSPYAAEGTKAHALGEIKVRYALWKADGMTAKKHGEMTPEQRELYTGIPVARYKALRKELIDQNGDIPSDMEKATDTYSDVIIERYLRAKESDPSARLFVEQRLNFSKWVPHGFGTGDAIIISNTILDVVDYKHGANVFVPAEGNPQLRLYALGALVRYGALYDFQTVRYTIVQPRMSNLSEDYISTDDLLAWAKDVVSPRARLAWEGKGELLPGEHCRFCSARAVCSARAAQAMKIFDSGLAGSGELSDDQITALLPALEAAETWIKDVREYAENRAAAGQKFAGYKLVRGRKPGRKWVADDKVVETLLRAGYGPEQFEETKLKSVAEVEKALGKTAFRALLGGFTAQGEGKLTLVPESDPRPEYSSADAAFSDMTETTDKTD